MAESTNSPEYSQGWWMAEIEATEKYLDEKWRGAGDKVVDRYLDLRRDSSSNLSDQEGAKKYNIFWANTQIIKSALYATPPKPSVSRANGDAKDDVARVAALILQRMLQNDLDADDSDMHNAFSLACDDWLIPGLGQVWLRYYVETEQTQQPAVLHPSTGQTLAPASTGMRISEECVCTDYVHWRDFLFSVTRTWDEKWWLGRRCWMKKKDFIKQFSKAQYDELKANSENSGKTNEFMPKGFTKGKVEVFEIWCEETNKVYWLNRHSEQVLRSVDDPLKLDGFYPCPRPVVATVSTREFIPRSDYTMCADQYDELDTLNDRISTLTRALRVVGVYDKTNTELARLLSGGEFNMIPVDNWAAFAEVGGLKGQVDWFPVDVIAEVLERLMVQRESVIAQIYQITSISDIQRGASNPRETLGAQKLKAQYSSVRLQLKQQDMAKFVRQALRIKAEIIARHFQPETIVQKSQIMSTESAQFAMQAVMLIKDYEASEYRIKVGEETLSLADYNAERELRTEYLTSVGQFLSQSASLVEVMPGSLPYILKLIQWVTAAFRGSADMESVLDAAITSATQNPPGQQGDGGAAEAQSKLQIAQMKAQSDAQKAQTAAQVTMAKTQADNATKERIATRQDQTQVLIEEMKEGAEQQALAVEVTGIKADLAKTSAQMTHDATQAAADRGHEAIQASATRTHEATQASVDRSHESAQASQQRQAAQHLQDTKPVPKPGGSK